jgi:hypothetical protein
MHTKYDTLGLDSALSLKWYGSNMHVRSDMLGLDSMSNPK